MAQKVVRSKVHAAGQDKATPNIIFDQYSDSATSHTIVVEAEPCRVMAFGLQGNQYIEVEQVTGDGSGTDFQAFAPAGVPYRLTSNTSTLVLEWAGNYRFRLYDDEEIETPALGNVKCIAYRFSMTHEWNYILAQSLRELLDRLRLSVEDTATLDLTLTFDGVNGSVLSGDVIVSADSDNQMTVEADGLKSRAYVEAGTGIVVTGVGTEADPYIVSNICCDEGELPTEGAQICIQTYTDSVTYADCSWVGGENLGPLFTIAVDQVNFGTPPYNVIGWFSTVNLSAKRTSADFYDLFPLVVSVQSSGPLNSLSDTAYETYSVTGVKESLFPGVDFDWAEDMQIEVSFPSAVTIVIQDSLGVQRTFYAPVQTTAATNCGSVTTEPAVDYAFTRLIIGKNTQNCGGIGTTQSLEVCVEPSAGTSDAGFSSPGTSLPDVTLTAYSYEQTRFTVYVPVGNQTYDTAGPHEIDFSNVTVTASWTLSGTDVLGTCTQINRFVWGLGTGLNSSNFSGNVITLTNLASLNTGWLEVTFELPAGAPLDGDYTVTVLVDGYVTLRALGNSVTTNHYIPTGNAATIVCGDYSTNPGSAYTDQFLITGVAASVGLDAANLCVSPGTHDDIDLSAENISTTERSLTVTVSGINGGTPPYSVDFSNLTFTGTCLEGATNRLTGITETANTVSGVALGGSASITATLDVDTAAYDITQNGSASIGIASGSYVTITDAALNTLTLYIPTSSDDPGAEVCGIVTVDPVDAYLDTWDIIGTGVGGGPTDPLGVGAGGGLFIGPSVGYPYEYFPDWQTTDIFYPITEYPIWRCLSANYDPLYRVPVVVAIRNITGGVPPYTVDFSGLTFTFTADWDEEFPSCQSGTETPTVTVTYTGGTGSASSPVRTNVGLGHGDLVATPDQGTLVDMINPLRSLFFQWSVTGSVVVTDSAANTITFNIPTASDGVIGSVAPGGPSGTYVDNYTHAACRPNLIPCA